MNEKNLSDFAKKEIIRQGYHFKWPLHHMKREQFKKGYVLFKLGDNADKLYYIQKGSIRLIETNRIIGEGDVIGEMGLFSPLKQRTASAVCEEDLEAYTMGRGEVLNFLTRDPSLALSLVQLSVGRFIENLKRETQERERIASELRIAAEIQTSMLPRKFPPFPERKEFDIFATMSPAREVGGDFYDFFFVEEDKLCFLIADVCGKGVPAALFMAISKTLLRTEASRGLSAGEILSRVNNIVYPDNDSSMFLTAFCIILNTETGEIEFANGGHNPPLLYVDGRRFEFMQVARNLAIGVMPDAEFESQKLVLKPNDVILMYTDGVTEAVNPEGQLFSNDRLKDCLLKLSDTAPIHVIESVNAKIATYTRGMPQYDDITMLALRFNGK